MTFTTSSAALLFGQQHNHQLSCLSPKNKVILYPSLSSNPSVCWVIHVQLFATPWIQLARLPCPSLFPRVCSNSCPLMSSNHLILCCPLLFLLSIFPSIKVFSNEPSLCIRWPKYCSFSFSISPSNEYSGLISFRIDCYDLFADQRDSQESSPAPPFKSMNSSALSLLYGQTLTSVHDYWKNHSFDYKDRCRQSDPSVSPVNVQPRCISNPSTFLQLHSFNLLS